MPGTSVRLAFCPRLRHSGPGCPGPDSCHQFGPPVHTLEPSDRTHLLPTTPAARASSPGSTCPAGFPPVACSSPARPGLVLMRAWWVSPFMVLSLAFREEHPPRPEQFGLGPGRAGLYHWSREQLPAQQGAPPIPTPPPPGLLLDFVQCRFLPLGGVAGELTPQGTYQSHSHHALNTAH